MSNTNLVFLPSILYKKEIYVQNNSELFTEKIHHCQWISAQAPDSAKDQYEKFLKLTFLMSKDTFSQFQPLQICIDELVFTVLYSELSIDRCFSINKELLAENLEKTSHIRQQVVHDHPKAFYVEVYHTSISQALV